MPTQAKCDYLSNTREVISYMGEAKRRSKRNAVFLEKHPFCCFCGGEKPATTIDHVPSIQLFRLRKRPKGLEFPACKKCNNSTGTDELVVALLSRFSEVEAYNKLEKMELEELIKAVGNNRSGLLQELKPSWQQQYDFDNLNHPEVSQGSGAANASGPMLNLSIQIFGAKLCKALHYEYTNKIVPNSGEIYVRWFSNYDRMTGNIPDSLISQLPEPRTLKQGKWNVRDQFEYSFVVSEDEKHGIYFATFQKSFAICSFVSFQRNFFTKVDVMKAHFPGESFSL